MLVFLSFTITASLYIKDNEHIITTKSIKNKKGLFNSNNPKLNVRTSNKNLLNDKNLNLDSYRKLDFSKIFPDPILDNMNIILKKIQSYFGIVTLPLEKLYKELENLKSMNIEKKDSFFIYLASKQPYERQSINFLVQEMNRFYKKLEKYASPKINKQRKEIIEPIEQIIRMRNIKNSLIGDGLINNLMHSISQLEKYASYENRNLYE
ncbi:hypothetical protein NUSPORA_01601 [Nucleospora cyclopteri]